MPHDTTERRCATCNCVLAQDNRDEICSPCARTAWEKRHAAQMAEAERKATRQDRAARSRRPRAVELAGV